MKQIAVSVPPRQALASGGSGSGNGHETRCLTAVMVMYGFWRKSDAFDPEIFAAGAAAVLSEYEMWVVDLVTDPRTGLPSRLQFPPTVKEIRDACNTLVEERERINGRRASLRAQLAESAEYERQQAERKNHPTQAELETMLGRSLGSKRPLPAAAPERIWERWCEDRRSGATLHPDARAILEAAGYDADGPDDQQLPEQTGGEPCQDMPQEQAQTESGSA